MQFSKFNISKLKSKAAAFTSVAALSILTACGGGITGGKGERVDLDKPVIVAMLVPKGGSLQDIGRSLEEGGLMAIAELNKNDIDLRVYSTGGDPARAVQAATQAKAAGASLILGPLTTAETLAVYKTADVPIISFSNNADAVESDSYILGTSFKLISDRLASYSKSIGDNRISMVYVDDLSGEQGAAAMAAAARDNGLAIASSNRYPLSVAAIDGVAPQIASQIKASQADSVFFTDTPNAGLPLITQALVNQGVTNDVAQYLGLASWDAPASALTLSQLQGGVFTSSPPQTTAAFNAKFRARTGYEPHPLAGIGYDGVAAAIALIQDARRTNDKTPFSASDIHSIRFNGAYGPVEFANDNHAVRDLVVLQVTNGSARQVSGPSR